MENELADLEYKFNNVEGKDIRRTRFGVRGDGKGGYEHYVIDQELL